MKNELSGPAVVAAKRTPVGKQHGALSHMRVDDLAAHILRSLAADVPADLMEEVAVGMVNASGEAMGNPARFATLLAGLPESVGGFTTNRYCGSGLTALTLLAADIAMGAHKGGIAIGAESMSRSTWPVAIPLQTKAVGQLVGRNAMWSGAGGPQHPDLEASGAMIEMAEAAQMTAMDLGISRADMDAYALESHRRAGEAAESGRFDEEILPVPLRDGEFSRDETIRHDTTLERLATLRGYDSMAPDITAGNASPINDGASGVVVINRQLAKDSGLPVMAELVAYSTIGVAPRNFSLGPVLAVQRLLERRGLATSDIDLFEINEAFASQVLACIRGLDIDHSRVNVNGGAIALGHALGNSGTRITVTLLHEMQRRDVEWGVASLCVGAGQGIAALFRRRP